jgi:precorrin-6Y C5,15-methyltransferase (decarboxylating)
VLASGDPFFFGVGSLLAERLDRGEFRCLPAPSSFSLAAARLGWPLQACRLLSLHGRDLRLIIPHLQPQARLLALSWDETTPAQLAALLVARGCGGSRLHIFEALGGPRERHRESVAAAFEETGLDPLNIVAIEVVPGEGARLLPLGTGLDDCFFETDGQLTRHEVRACVLSALAPFRGAQLWDVGAGSGSVAIEWMLLDPSNRAIAIEARADRAARIARNAGALGVPNLDIVQGSAPEALSGLAPPDSIFIGGGASDAVIAACRQALKPGGRLVVNAVTIETEARLTAHFTETGGSLTRLSVAEADPIGRFHGWRPAMPITQWIFRKPREAGGAP